MFNPFAFGINIICIWSVVDMICLLCNNLIFNPILVKYNCSVKMNTTYVFNLKAITNSVGVGMALVLWNVQMHLRQILFVKGMTMITKYDLSCLTFCNDKQGRILIP